MAENPRTPWRGPLRYYLSAWLLIISGFVCIDAEPQFRSEQNRDIYNEPYNRPSTSRPLYGYPQYPHSNDQNPYRYPNQNQQFQSPENIRYRGYDYNANERGGVGISYGTRERDRLRLNYNQQNPEYQQFETKNTIFDRWRPDLQGEKRPGETPGINLPLAEDTFVSTDTGKLQGFYVYLYDQPGARFDERPVNKPMELQRHVLNVTVFLGVPYAQPPYNEGRFKPPRRVHNWHTTWQSIDYSPACPQNLKYIGASKGIRSGIDEDCLYLNIFTPSLSVNARERYPVMFYIHGGDFDHGSGSQFPGHMLSAWGEVVVVTINYRLGALGFLSTGDYHSPGNYGLMDMALALEWVYNNIRFFNGDRDRISVFGPGAGGAAAGLLAVLPKTRDWVRQVLAESGSPLADWAAIDDPYRVQNTSRVFGLEMGCNVDTSFSLLHCLVNRDYEELATAPITPDVGTFAWSPVVDGNFTVPGDSWYEEWNEADFHILPDLPIKMYMKNEHHPFLRYLTGVNRDEAANFVFNDVRLSKNNFVVTEDFFNERIKEWVKHYNYTLNPEGAYDAIKWMYTFWPDPHNTTHIREQYINMLSDALYKSGVDQIVKVLTNSTGKRAVPTYYYLLNTTIEALKLPLWREVPNNLEYYLISGAPFMDPDFYPDNYRVSRQLWTEGDRNMSQFMMKTFANFARWGNPTQQQVEPIKVNWEPTVDGALKYLSINNTFNTTIHYNYHQIQNTFWYVYMPMVVREYVPTPPPPRNPWIDMKEPVTATMYGLLAVVVAFLVVLCVCCGLWKSAKRQRNKALDDLSYYSTENLTLAKDEDYEVRNYLEKLGGLRQQNPPSRSETLNTVVSSDHAMQSRPITPSVGMTSNGKVPRQENISEPDNTVNLPIPAKRSISKPLPQNNSKREDSFPLSEKPFIMELEEPSRVIRGHPVTSYNPAAKIIQEGSAKSSLYNNQIELEEPSRARREPTVTSYNPHVGVNYEKPAPITLYNNSNFVVDSNKDLMEHELGIPELPPYSANVSQYDFQPTLSGGESYEPQTYTPQDLPNGHAYSPMHHTDVAYEPQPEVSGEINQRPITPVSAVTFGISMKPSRSVGTISNASGLILNTDL